MVKFPSLQHVKENGITHTLLPFYKNIEECDSKHFLDEWLVLHFFYGWFYTLFEKKSIIFIHIIWEIFEILPIANRFWAILINLVINNKKNKKKYYPTNDSLFNLVSDILVFSLGILLSKKKKKKIKENKIKIIRIYITISLITSGIWLFRYKNQKLILTGYIIFIYYILFILYLRNNNLI